MKIELGGGANPRKDFLNVDIREIPEVDYVCDFELEDLPFEDGSVDEIYTNHTFEHLSSIIHIMNEAWRVLADGGVMTIKVPHKDCTLAWQDPTHKSYYTEENMKYFCGDYLKKYKLDYGIKSCFQLLSNNVEAPDGRPEYFQEITFVLQKDRAHFDEVDYGVLEWY